MEDPDVSAVGVWTGVRRPPEEKKVIFTKIILTKKKPATNSFTKKLFPSFNDLNFCNFLKPINQFIINFYEAIINYHFIEISNS